MRTANKKVEVEPEQEPEGEQLEAELEEPSGDGPSSEDPPIDPPVETRPPQKIVQKPPEEKTSRARILSSAPIAKLHREEDQSVVEWLRTLQGSGPIQIRLHRLKPAMFDGKVTKGHLNTLDDMISEDEIRDQYGGGTYQLRIMRRSDNGSWVFLTSTSVDIAGDPRIDTLPKANPGASSKSGESSAQRPIEESPMMGKAFDFMAKQAERANDRRDTGPDLEQIRMMMRPMEIQITALNDSLKAKEDQLQTVLNKPANPFQEKLLDKMIDQDSARVTAVREQLMSEIRVIKENAIADERRLRDAFERDKQQIYNAHEREISNLKQAHDLAIQTVRSSFDTQKSVLEADIRRLERDNTEMRGDVKELRAKKEKTIPELAKEMNDVKKALGVEDDDDDDKDKSTIEKVADIAMNSDKLFDFANKWLGMSKSGGEQQQIQQKQNANQPVAQPRVIRRKDSGQVFMRDEASGKYKPVRRRRAQDGEETDEVEEGVQISPDQAQKALEMLEMAFQNGIKPEVVATTARTAVPEEILAAIRDHGVDGFLKKVAKLPSTSPLAAQDGMNWVRKFGKALIE